MRVIVTGRLKQRTFDDKEGQRRTTVEIDAEEIAASLTYATATVTKTYRPGAVPRVQRHPCEASLPDRHSRTSPRRPPRPTRSEPVSAPEGMARIVQHSQSLIQ